MKFAIVPSETGKLKGRDSDCKYCLKIDQVLLYACFVCVVIDAASKLLTVSLRDVEGGLELEWVVDEHLYK